MTPRTHLWKLVRQWLRPTLMLKPPAPMTRRAEGKMLGEVPKDEGRLVEGGAARGMMDVVRNAGARIMGAPLMGMFLFVFWIPVLNNSCTMIIETNTGNTVAIAGTKTTA